jgi:hypothetical protein
MSLLCTFDLYNHWFCGVCCPTTYVYNNIPFRKIATLMWHVLEPTTSEDGTRSMRNHETCYGLIL